MATNVHSITLEVVSVTGASVEELVWVNLPLADQETEESAFAGGALALNLHMNVPEFPGVNRHLRAMCSPRFGFEGAKVAIVACPYDPLRRVLQEVVRDAPDLPHSPLGGPSTVSCYPN